MSKVLHPSLRELMYFQMMQERRSLSGGDILAKEAFEWSRNIDIRLTGWC